MSYEYATGESMMAVEDAFNEIDFDFDKHIGIIPGERKRSDEIIIKNGSQLIGYLTAICKDSFYSNIVFDSGEAVFCPDALTWVYEFLEDKKDILDELEWKI